MSTPDLTQGQREGRIVPHFLFTKQMLVCSFKTVFQISDLPFCHVTGEATEHLNSKFIVCIFIRAE